MAEVGNWVSEGCLTTGSGNRVLSGPVSASNTRFRDTVPAGEVWASIIDGDKQEAGVYLFNGVDTLTPVTIHATYQNLIYNNVNPVPLNLSGNSVISCTFNSAAFRELEDHTHTILDMTDTPSTRANQEGKSLSANQAGNAEEYIQRVNFKGGYVLGATYYNGDEVRDDTWLMGCIAGLGGTTDRAAPQPVGDKLWTMKETPVWVPSAFSGTIQQELRIKTPPNTYRLEKYRIWVSSLSSTVTYRVITRDNSTGELKNIFNAVGGDFASTGWQELTSDTIYIGSTADKSIILLSQDKASSTTLVHPYIYIDRDRDPENTDPGTGNFTYNRDTFVIRFSTTDSGAVDRTADLDTISIGDTVKIIGDNDLTEWVEFEVQALPNKYATYYTFASVLTNEGSGGRPNANEGSTANWTLYTAASTDYQIEVDSYIGSPTLSSVLLLDGVAQAGTVNGNGIDVNYQAMTESPDWYIKALSGGAASSGGAAPTIIRDDFTGLGISNEASSANTVAVLDRDKVDRIATVTTLRTTDGLLDGRAVLLLGYTTNGDGGGGEFYWNAASVDADNGVTIFKVSTVTTGRWIRNYNTTINILWAGAVNDGATDSTAAIQAALDLGGSIFIPDGDFAFTSLVIGNFEETTITGSSRLGTTLTCIGASGIGIQFKGTSRSVIEKLRIVGNANMDVGIQIDNDSATKYAFTFGMSDVEARGFSKAGAIAFLSIGTSHMQLQNVNFEAASGTGCEIRGDAFNTGVFAFNNVYFNTKSGDYGLYVSTGTAIDSMGFVGCYFAGSLAAERIGDSNNNVNAMSHIGCHYENNSAVAGAALVHLAGGSGLGAKSMTWTSCQFGGFSVCENAFKYDQGVYFGHSIENCTFQGILATGYIIGDHVNALFKDCHIKSIHTATTTPNNFLTNNFRDDGGWVGGWVIQDDGVFDVQKVLSLTGIRTFADEAAAITAGLPTGRVYQTATGELRIKL